MTTLSASDIAALRIREARNRQGWTVKDLAARCRKAGIPRLTAAVITNLETRRRPGREISAEELLALALVLQVPPLQLLIPFGSEELAITPAEGKDPLEATAWLTDDDAAALPVWRARSPKARDTERVLRAQSSPLTVMRQIRSVTRSISLHDRGVTDEAYRIRTGETVTFHRNSIDVLALRLAYLLDALEAFRQPWPGLAATTEILARYGISADPREWLDDDDEAVSPVESS